MSTSSDVKKREQIYWGPLPKPNTRLHNSLQQKMASRKTPRNNKKKPAQRYVNDNPRWSGGHDGTHDPTDIPGIIAIKGPKTRKPGE